MSTMRVIDADGHVMEPMTAWKSVPEEHRLHSSRDSHGLDHVMVGNQQIAVVSLGRLGTLDSPLRLLLGRTGAALRRSDGADAGPRCRSVRAAARQGGARIPRGVPPPEPVPGTIDRRPGVRTVLGCRRGARGGDRHPRGLGSAIETLGNGRKPFNPLIIHAVSHAFEQMYACAQLIATGVLERHPGLHVAFLEAGGAWAPYWLWRLDEQVHGFGGFCPEMHLLPSEYFARQCWVSFEIDEPLLPTLLPHLGTDRVIWGSDYPHHDSTFPGAVDALRATLAPLDAASQQKVLGENALALYRMA